MTKTNHELYLELLDEWFDLTSETMTATAAFDVKPNSVWNITEVDWEDPCAPYNSKARRKHLVSYLIHAYRAGEDIVHAKLRYAKPETDRHNSIVSSTFHVLPMPSELTPPIFWHQVDGAK